MGAQLTHIQQADGLATLRALIELAGNPKQIIEAHELARKQQALTDDEAKKAAESKDFIASSNQLKKDLEAKELALNEAKKIHEQGVAAKSLEHQNKTQSLKDEEEKLKNLNASQVEVGRDLAKQSRQLDADKKTFDDYRKVEQKKLDDAASENLRVEKSNAAETHRLALLKLRLESKATKLQEAIAI